MHKASHPPTLRTSSGEPSAPRVTHPGAKPQQHPKITSQTQLTRILLSLTLTASSQFPERVCVPMCAWLVVASRTSWWSTRRGKPPLFAKRDLFCSNSFSCQDYIDLSSNELTGEIPGALAKFDVDALYLANNKFTGIDDELCDPKLGDSQADFYLRRRRGMRRLFPLFLLFNYYIIYYKK